MLIVIYMISLTPCPPGWSRVKIVFKRQGPFFFVLFSFLFVFYFLYPSASCSICRRREDKHMESMVSSVCLLSHCSQPLDVFLDERSRQTKQQGTVSRKPTYLYLLLALLSVHTLSPDCVNEKLQGHEQILIDVTTPTKLS
jgi:hypothetical protein